MTTTKRHVGRPFGTFKYSHPSRVNGKLTKTYCAWQAMIARCHNPKNHNFKWYGERGIAVCPEWRSPVGYASFLASVGVAPDGLTLERIDNSKGYEPGNCKWATMQEQANNRRKTGKVTPDSLRQKAIKAGLSYSVVYQRVKLLGWAEVLALSTPKLPRGVRR